MNKTKRWMRKREKKTWYEIISKVEKEESIANCDDRAREKSDESGKRKKLRSWKNGINWKRREREKRKLLRAFSVWGKTIATITATATLPTREWWWNLKYEKKNYNNGNEYSLSHFCDDLKKQ